MQKTNSIVKKSPTPDFSTENINKILLELPTFSQIDEQKHYSKLDPDHNYFFEVSNVNGNGALHYFGTNHSPDPKDPQYKKIRKLINEFEKRHKKIIYIVESYYPEHLSDEAEAITKYSESGLIVYHATKNNIPYVCYEMGNQKALEIFAERKISKRDISFFYFAQLFMQLYKNPEYRNDIASYINGSLSFLYTRGIINTEDIYKFVSQEFESVEQVSLKFPLSDTAVVKLKKHGYPNDTNACGLISRIRDARVVIAIKTFWEHGYGIFVTYGSSHALRQEAILRRALLVKGSA